MEKTKNTCTSAVAEYLGTLDATPELRTMGDMLNSARSKYNVEQRHRFVRNMTVDYARDVLRRMTEREELNPEGYMVFVGGHVIFLNPEGQTVVDTTPMSFDNRTVTECFVVYS